MKALSSLLALVVLGAATVQAQEAPAAGAAVTAEAVLARSIVDRVPQDTGTAFPADVGELTLWTRVTGAAAESVIHHVWMRGDEQVADIEGTWFVIKSAGRQRLIHHDAKCRPFAHVEVCLGEVEIAGRTGCNDCVIAVCLPRCDRKVTGD